MTVYMGLILVVLSWILGGYIVTKAGRTNAMSVSEHAAVSRRLSVLLAVILCGLGAAFYVWLIVWVVPKLNLGSGFSLLLNIMFVCQFIAGLVPDVTGRKRLIHRAAAYGFAVLYLPLSFLLFNSSAISAAGKWVGAVCFAYLITSLLLVFAVPKAKNNYLLFQILYIAVFQLQILVSAYSIR